LLTRAATARRWPTQSRRRRRFWPPPSSPTLAPFPLSFLLALAAFFRAPALAAPDPAALHRRRRPSVPGPLPSPAMTRMMWIGPLLVGVAREAARADKGAPRHRHALVPAGAAAGAAGAAVATLASALVTPPRPNFRQDLRTPPSQHIDDAATQE
jgi:hypothetical protein